MMNKYNPDFLYDLAKLFAEKNEFGKAIYIYTILVNNYDYSTYSTKAGYDLEKLLDKPYSITSEEVSPDHYKISYSFSLSYNELVKLTLINLVIFMLLGPFFGGLIVPVLLLSLSFSGIFFFFVYAVGIIPAAFASIIFSLFMFFLINRNNKRPRFLQICLASALSGVIAVVMLFPIVSEFRNDFHELLFFSSSGLLGGVVSGLISGLIMRSQIKPNKSINYALPAPDCLDVASPQAADY